MKIASETGEGLDLADSRFIGRVIEKEPSKLKPFNETLQLHKKSNHDQDGQNANWFKKSMLIGDTAKRGNGQKTSLRSESSRATRGWMPAVADGTNVL